MKQNAYNIVGLGVTLSAGKWYKGVWFYEGEPALEEVYYCPDDVASPKKHFKRWLGEIGQFLTLLAVDIHIKPLEITNDPLRPDPYQQNS